MIRTGTEYRKSVERLKDERETIADQLRHFKTLGYSGTELERLVQPLVSFHEQLKEEVEVYEQMKRGDLGVLENFNNIGRWLVGIRIARGLSQKELADKLNVSSAQVSRDEINEYHGITLEKAQRILEVLSVRFRAKIKDPYPISDENNDDLSYV